MTGISDSKTETRIPEPREGVPVVEVRGLTKHFSIHKGLLRRQVGTVKAVNGVSFRVPEGKTLGLVGESGCGKTTTGRTLLLLMEPGSGEIYFRGVPIHNLSPAEMAPFRRKMQVIFQDPFSSLNPRMTVEMTVGEALVYHGLIPARRRRDKVVELLEKVGLSGTVAGRYPHEFSGGQRQRIGIARALAMNPAFIVCDEAVSALDVSVQAQIINLLRELQRNEGIAYLFIAHDMAVVRHISHRVAVMYLGRIVEIGESSVVFGNPIHPYTRALLSAVPPDAPGENPEREELSGEPPSAANPPPGCAFAPRCRYARPECSIPPADGADDWPPLVERSTGHFSRCLFQPNEWEPAR